MKPYNYFSRKSIGQRIRLIIALVALLTFCFFIIKGNFFDNTADTTNQAASQAEIIEVTTSEATSEVTQTTEPPSFHVSIIDVGLLVAVVTAYAVHKMRERKRERR